MGYIYKLINTVNNKVYVGQTIQNLCTRMYGHRHAKAGSRHLVRAIRKYGFDVFRIDILEECANDSLDDREIYYIRKLNTTNPAIGYNMTEGGSVNRNPSEEIRKKMSDTRRGRKLSEEHRLAISAALRGREFTDEWKQKIRDAKANVSEETCQKISKAHKGRKHTVESRENMSQGQKKFIYTIVDPEGNTYTTDNLNKFCTDYYTKGTLATWRAAIRQGGEVLSGRYKGWKITQRAKSAVEADHQE